MDAAKPGDARVIVETVNRAKRFARRRNGPLHARGVGDVGFGAKGGCAFAGHLGGRSLRDGPVEIKQRHGRALARQGPRR